MMDAATTQQVSALLDYAQVFLMENWSIIAGALGAFIVFKVMKAGLKIALLVLVMALVVRIVPELAQLI